MVNEAGSMRLLYLWGDGLRGNTFLYDLTAEGFIHRTETFAGRVFAVFH